MSERKEKQLAALSRLASVLGAQLLIEESDDIVEATADVAKRRGTTYIFVGESRPRRGLARLREPLPQRLMRGTPQGVDVRIVAHRGEPRTSERGGQMSRARGGADRARVWRSPAAGGFLIARRRARRPAAPRRVPPDPAAVHRTGDLAAGPRRRAAPGQGRERDSDARLSGDRSRCSFRSIRPARAASKCLPLLEAIEQRAAAQGVPVDARIEVGRSYRHALLRLLEQRPSIASSSRPPPYRGSASRATIWSGCSRRPRPRS